MLLLPLLLALGCGPGGGALQPEPPAPPAPATSAPLLAPELPDLVVVLVGGLRADARGVPGAEAAFLAPFEGELELLTTAAYAQSPDPFVSLGSLLTGRYPSAVPLCGSVRRGPGSTLEEAWCHQLPSGGPSLPGVLELYGYRTLLAHGLGPVPGLSSAFGSAFDLAPGASDWPAIRNRVEAWWDGGTGEPRLLVLQLSDLDLPHRPDLLGAFDGAEGDWAGLTQGAPPSTRAPVSGERLRPRRPPCTPLVHQQESAGIVWDAFGGGEIQHEFVRSQLLETYRREAQAVGRNVHALLGALEAPRVRHVVLAGLHGVSVGELGGTLADESEWVWTDRVANRTVHVPLAVAGSHPGFRLLETPVELVDVLPTLLVRAGAVPPHGLPGGDLLEPGVSEESDVAYVEYGDMLALRRGELLLSMRAMVHNMSSLDPYLTEVLSCPGLVGGFSLHDIAADPLQTRDLLAEREAEALAMESLLLERRLGHGAPAPVLYEDDRLLRLRLMRAEGYW